MGYSAKASRIRSRATSLDSIATSAKGISFGSVWNGENYNKLTTDLSNVLNSINTTKANLDSYASGLDKLQKYKDNTEEIKNLNNQINTIYNIINNNEANDESITNNQNRISTLNHSLKLLEEENQKLKSEIQSIMSSFSTTSSGLSATTFELNGDYVAYIEDMITKYSNNQLDYLYGLAERYASGELKQANLYDYVEQSYIEDGLLYIQENYSQRESAIYCSMFLTSVAAENGIKIRYLNKFSGSVEPFVSTKKLVGGTDCEATVDWFVDKGREDGFSWRYQRDNSYKNVGTEIEPGENYENWANATSGDLFVSSGHVGVIMENDPDNRTFICFEATMGQHFAVAVTTRTYDELIEKNYQIQDMTEVYAGVNDEYTQSTIQRYNRYVDWDTYQRKP